VSDISKVVYEMTVDGRTWSVGDVCQLESQRQTRDYFQWRQNC